MSSFFTKARFLFLKPSFGSRERRRNCQLRFFLPSMIFDILCSRNGIVDDGFFDVSSTGKLLLRGSRCLSLTQALLGASVFKSYPLLYLFPKRWSSSSVNISA